ncbi:phosphorylase/glycogen(starch) synthase [Balneicella halophila]|uniref:Phosphorylase/glycogen(Starch) synthase n=1 Tax=Balneicella halophila TaxID=1537566 RepID=A0A7L4UQC5_BALHA|nr:alpha-glucan family phosphorylase [Balneicella halophila]PVX49940.1 phosphorylase/glycogen(starch) synthase [Balneicella halophila]
MKQYEEIDFIFETSWEVCNKVGGIHTVIKSKLPHLQKIIGDNLVYIGPDIWKKDNTSPEFIEDTNLYSAWKHKATSEGLRVRTGYWNIEGKPKVILVDFTTFIHEKDNLLAKLWEDYSLDSLTGGWNYVESVLFGYAASKVIESFVDFETSYTDKILAHFHEWMTASGVLYLKKYLPHIATVFTTHATSLGRSICSNNQKLYNYLEADKQHPKNKARELNIFSQHSIEKKAAEHSDAFTTVSDITGKECKVLLGKKPDVITPNGFWSEDNQQLAGKRDSARIKLKDVARALTGSVSDDALLIATSGRYEFRNKGLDLFIDALTNLREQNIEKEVVAFILVPAWQKNVNLELQRKLAGEDVEIYNKMLTHHLMDEANDKILNSLAYHQFYNAEEDKVKIIFAPVYLDGNDGIFNQEYYDLLAGFDLTLFPSYYEPWGYTPLESVAYGVPTLTSSLAGFGVWSKENTANQLIDGIKVIERNDENYKQAEQQLADEIASYASYSNETYEQARNSAFKVAEKALWENFFDNYKQAYSIAISKVEDRISTIIDTKKKKESRIIKEMEIENTPNWKKLIVQSDLPDNLDKLEELSMNLWWVWNDEAQELFEEIDPDGWVDCKKNPLAILRMADTERLAEIGRNEEYINKLDRVYNDFKEYMSSKPAPDANHIGYFSMEYGLTNLLKIYSGGLGILAGDYLKAASDTNQPLVAVGFMYRYGYFTQRLSAEGYQISEYESQVFSELPAKMLRDNTGEPLRLSVSFPGRDVYFRIWQVQVGRVDLYLLDTDTHFNTVEDRSISYKLYGGDWENRIKQELVLGMGGMKLLRELNVKTNIYHLNEGHAAFANLERLTYNMEQYNLSFDEALEVVRAASLFTTHTPVPAGHDSFSEDFIRTYLRHMPERLNISWEAFLGLGRFNPSDSGEKFSMSVFAAKTSSEINGVSKLHGKVSREMFAHLWPGFASNELALGHVTNGVHYSTWTAKEWKDIHKRILGEEYIHDLSNKEIWSRIYNLDDAEIWEVRNSLRKNLIDFIKRKIVKNWIRRHEDPSTLVDIQENLSDKTLTLGFARRFATYKRAHLLFTDLDRLNRLLNAPDRPVQILFAGKAHPADKAGQDLIKNIVEISRKPEFVGKILFLENYDMDLAKHLISGVDVWLNNPTRPLEASGTSGQKAEMNGALNFSVLDGWWVEGYKEGAGWALPEERTYEEQFMQDKLDAATIYHKLENEVIPLFYDRDENHIPHGWIQYIKKSFAEIAPEFTTKRMIDDYNNKFYKKLHIRASEMRADNFKQAEDLAAWKKKIQNGWDKIEVVKYEFPDTVLNPYISGEQFAGTIVLDLKELQEQNIGVEMVFTNSKRADNMEIEDVQELKLDRMEGSLAYYTTQFNLSRPGVYDYGLRIFPKNEKLAHRQDFPILKWI